MSKKCDIIMNKKGKKFIKWVDHWLLREIYLSIISYLSEVVKYGNK